MDGFAIPRIGLARGLALLWLDGVDVDIQTSSSHHIDTLIKQEGVVWHLIGFYEHPKTSRRGKSWDLLRQLHASFSLPWLLLGDFNEILLPNEYWGSGSKPYNQIAEFTRLVEDCLLMDLGFKRPKFTWCNRRFEGNLVYARLDRGLHNQEWLQLFAQSSLSHIPFGFSNHMAIMVKIETFPQMKPTKKHRFFRFEAFWIRDPNCEDIIRLSWELLFWGIPMFKLT